MYICNITFIIAPEERDRFLSWMRGSTSQTLFAGESPARNPRLQTVIEAGGEKPDPEHGLSIALSAEFETEMMAHEWHDTVLPGVLGDFHSEFAPQAAFFITLLEILSL